MGFDGGRGGRGLLPGGGGAELSLAAARWPGTFARVKLLSWNVNGLRAALRKNFLDFLAAEAPDVIALQETKCTAEDVPTEWRGYQPFWHSAEKKGYSGTGILTKTPPLSVSRGIGVPEHDREGRVITLEFEAFILINVYVPNSQRELARLGYRQEWDRACVRYLSGLQARKPLICCGDSSTGIATTLP